MSRPSAPSPVTELAVRLTVNGQPVERTIPVRRLLCDFLREDLSLTGTHVGCEQGVCGACTVLLDGEPVRSCTTLAVSADGGTVTTIEGLAASDGGLTPLQECFRGAHALQCGFCTPGIVVTVASADPAAHPTDADIERLLAGHLCRCTGYAPIVGAVRAYWGREA